MPPVVDVDVIVAVVGMDDLASFSCTFEFIDVVAPLFFVMQYAHV